MFTVKYFPSKMRDFLVMVILGGIMALGFLGG